MGLFMNNATTNLRVMTWNVWGRYGDWRTRMPIIIRTLRDANADIIALQEVWAESEGERVDQVEELADALGYDCHSFMKLGVGGICSGNALLARWQMTSKAYNLLPSNPHVTTEQRNAVYAV